MNDVICIFTIFLVENVFSRLPLVKVDTLAKKKFEDFSEPASHTWYTVQKNKRVTINRSGRIEQFHYKIDLNPDS